MIAFGFQLGDCLFGLVELRLDRRDFFAGGRADRFHLLSGLFVEQPPKLAPEVHQLGDGGFRQFHRSPLLRGSFAPLIEIALDRRVTAAANAVLHVQNGGRHALRDQTFSHLKNQLLRHHCLGHSYYVIEISSYNYHNLASQGHA